MKWGIRKPPFMTTLVIALLALLPLVALLQYRWIGQVSRAEQERMQASLRTRAAQFSQDFDREITRAYFSFQPAAAGDAPDQAWNQHAQSYAHWVATAPYPRLVGALFVLDAGAGDPFRLSRLDPATGRWETVAWPPEFSELRRRLETAPQNRRSDQPLVLGAVGMTEGEIPALVIPRLNISLLREHPTVNLALPILSYIIVKLDRDYIEQEFIPMLVRRHFSHDGLEYHLAIVARGQLQKMIYPSGAQGPSIDFTAADATADIFSVRFAEFKEDAPDRVLGMGGSLGASIAGAKMFSYRVYSRTARETAASAVVFRSPEARWQLRLKHRTGSLEAAVAGVRRRNLMVSFGILLLLTVSVAVLVASTQRAQRLARQQMEFVAGVSHELRTPLAVICSAAENLADGVIESGPQIRRYGVLIENEGRRLSEMVEQVLEFAGMQSGRRTFVRHPIDLADLVESALAAYQPGLKESGFVIEKAIPPDLPPVPADAAALQRGIGNLLSNAIKYAGENRWIGIRVAMRAGARGPEAQITIADKGLGIAPADLPHIFEPFYRGREVVTAQIHGSGLGLSLVKHIMEGHGGRVSVESVPGQGSSFTLHLPVVDAVRAVDSPPVESDGPAPLQRTVKN